MLTFLSALVFGYYAFFAAKAVEKKDYPAATLRILFALLFIGATVAFLILGK